MIASASLSAFSAGVAAVPRPVAPAAAAATDVARQKSGAGLPAGGAAGGQVQPGQAPPHGQKLPRGSLLDRSV